MRRRRPSAVLVTVLAGGAMLAACASPSESGGGGGADDGATEEPSETATTPAGSSEADIVGTWQLVDGTAPAGEITPLDDVPVVLGIGEDGTVAGDGGCNGYGGTIEFEDTTVKFTNIVSTMMWCDGGISDVETAYLEALDDVDTAQNDGEELVLTGEGIELHFTLIGDAPANS